MSAIADTETTNRSSDGWTTYKRIIRQGLMMLTPKYRIESNATLRNGLLQSIKFNHLYQDSSLAVAIAAKSVTEPARKEVRVVHIPTGEIIFRTSTFE